MSCYQFPIQAPCSRFTHLQFRHYFYKIPGETVIINSIDHKFKQYPPYQNGKRCDQHRLQEDTEF